MSKIRKSLIIKHEFKNGCLASPYLELHINSKTVPFVAQISRKFDAKKFIKDKSKRVQCLLSF